VMAEIVSRPPRLLVHRALPAVGLGVKGLGAVKLFVLAVKSGVANLGRL
jgi:hypothetical protein